MLFSRSWRADWAVDAFRRATKEYNLPLYEVELSYGLDQTLRNILLRGWILSDERLIISFVYKHHENDNLYAVFGQIDRMDVFIVVKSMRGGRFHLPIEAEVYAYPFLTDAYGKFPAFLEVGFPLGLDVVYEEIGGIVSVALFRYPLRGDKNEICRVDVYRRDEFILDKDAWVDFLKKVEREVLYATL